MYPALVGIVAMDKNRAIGKDNHIPWRLKNDMKFFQQTTKGSPVIMGRKTWESLPIRPLPNRYNIVLTSKPKELPFYDHVDWTTNSFWEAYDVAASKAHDTTNNSFVIGGQSIYNITYERLNTLLVSHVDTEIENADAFFPDVELPKTYLTIARFEKSDVDEYAFEIRRYIFNF